MDNLETLARVGRALHGPEWQMPTAKDLNVNDRTMERWLSRKQPVPDLRADLAKLCRTKSVALEALAVELEAS